MHIIYTMRSSPTTTPPYRKWVTIRATHIVHIGTYMQITATAATLNVCCCLVSRQQPLHLIQPNKLNQAPRRVCNVLPSTFCRITQTFVRWPPEPDQRCSMSSALFDHGVQLEPVVCNCILTKNCQTIVCILAV